MQSEEVPGGEYRGKGLDRELVALQAQFAADQPIDAEPEDVVEIAVWVCEHCFDGKIRFPLWVKKPRQTRGRWQDQGIDLFYDQGQVKARHECKMTNLIAKAGSQTKDGDMRLAFARLSQRRGKWIAKKMMLPAAVREEMLKQSWIDVGPQTIDRLA